MTKVKKLNRTTHGLRDVLFEEIEGLRNGTVDPSRSMAIANLAKQIINVAKVELDYHRMAIAHQEAGAVMNMGGMPLGNSAASAEVDAMEAPSSPAISASAKQAA